MTMVLDYIVDTYHDDFSQKKFNELVKNLNNDIKEMDEEIDRYPKTS